MIASKDAREAAESMDNTAAGSGLGSEDFSFDNIPEDEEDLAEQLRGHQPSGDKPYNGLGGSELLGIHQGKPNGKNRKQKSRGKNKVLKGVAVVGGMFALLIGGLFIGATSQLVKDAAAGKFARPAPRAYVFDDGVREPAPIPEAEPLAQVKETTRGATVETHEDGSSLILDSKGNFIAEAAMPDQEFMVPATGRQIENSHEAVAREALPGDWLIGRNAATGELEVKILGLGDINWSKDYVAGREATRQAGLLARAEAARLAAEREAALAAEQIVEEPAAELEEAIPDELTAEEEFDSDAGEEELATEDELEVAATEEPAIEEEALAPRFISDMDTEARGHALLDIANERKNNNTLRDDLDSQRSDLDQRIMELQQDRDALSANIEDLDRSNEDLDRLEQDISGADAGHAQAQIPPAAAVLAEGYSGTGIHSVEFLAAEGNLFAKMALAMQGNARGA